MKTICYLDMDDVVADFATQALRYIGNDCMKLKNKTRDEMTEEEKVLQNKLFHYCDYDNTFWETMPVKNGSYELYQYCLKHFDEVVFLSRFVPPKDKPNRLRAVQFLKTRWAYKHFAVNGKLPKVIVTSLSKEAFLQSRTGVAQVLVDDMYHNIRKWKDNGGAGILFFSPKDVMRYINQRTGRVCR